MEGFSASVDSMSLASLTPPGIFHGSLRRSRLVKFDLPVRVAPPQIPRIGATTHPRRVDPTDSRAPLESGPQSRLGLK